MSVLQVFFHREKQLKHIWRQVDNGEYRLLPPQLIRTGKQDDIVLWNAADALVMKWVALEIKGQLPLQSRCVHIAGHCSCGMWIRHSAVRGIFIMSVTWMTVCHEGAKEKKFF